MRVAVPSLILAVSCAALLATVAAEAEPPRTGPATEKRFPPLHLPAGFQATLFACDPLIEYPSAAALGPRPGSLFLAADYLTGLGTQTARRDEVRLVEDTDGDGYADRATVFADNFNSVQGLAYHRGTLYVMHAPLLTALRDTDGDGKADERRDLLTGLGLPPEQNPSRLHCANGVVVGHDGWLYLALGDHGCDVRRPEGDRLVLQEGGILRCRPDGRDLHVFATGLRNIYDVALDDELNVFVRDNENDGGDYKVRVCHSFFGADHGYPHLYYEHPDEALSPLADLGLGSSAGGLCYQERQFPAEYRGSLFFCEWGRSVVCYRLTRAGAGFAPVKEREFAAGDEKDPYGFKPTDLVTERDGSLLVADWADGQQARRGRGRVYRIRHTSHRALSGGRQPPERATSPRLDSDSYYERLAAQEALEARGPDGARAANMTLDGGLGIRGRLHAVWVLARAGHRDRLFDLAAHDPDPAVQAQAVRALADLSDPVLVRHRLDAGAGDAATATRLAALAEGKDPRVLLEAVIAAGRLRWADAPGWLRRVLHRPDPTLAHAAMQTLRRSGNWPAVLSLLDLPDAEPLRAIARRAVAGRFAPEVIDGLIERLRAERDPARRREYAELLTRVHRKPGAWVYWGYRPPPRPANTVAWERTGAIESALDAALAGRDPAVLRAMQREKVPTRMATLARWLSTEHDPGRIAVLLASLREHPAASTRPLVEAVAKDRQVPEAGRRAALELFAAGLDDASAGRLLDLAGTLEDGPLLAKAIGQLGKRPRLPAGPVLVRKLDAAEPPVRAAAAEALAEWTGAGGQHTVPTQRLRQLLTDRDPRVRRAAAVAAGKLGLMSAVAPLLELAQDADLAVRAASFEALRQLKEPRAVPLATAALADPATQPAALRCLADLAGPDQLRAVADFARRKPSADVLPAVLALLTRWGRQFDARRADVERTAADLQGASGVLARWHVIGPVTPAAAADLVARLAAPSAAPPDGAWQVILGTGTEARVRLKPAKAAGADAVWLAYTDLAVPEPATVQFLAGGNAAFGIWLNGKLAHQRTAAGSFQADAVRFDAVLVKGSNRVLFRAAALPGGTEVHLRLRRKGSTAEHERLTQAALGGSGDARRGRELFLNVEKTQCLKCHRLGDRGEQVGPELTGVGRRFGRIHIIESILDPSRTIEPGYQTTILALKDGRVFTGIKTAEADGMISLADSQGQKHRLRRADVEEERVGPLSTMPEGLEKRLSAEEFVDLIEFLAGQTGAGR